MDSVLNLSPVEKMLVLGLQLWITVIFPLLMLRKLNYVTSLLENLVDSNPSPDDDRAGTEAG